MEADPVAPMFDEPETLRERIARNLGVVVASKNLSPPHAAFRHKPLEKRRLRILQGLFYGLSRLDCTITVQGRETRTNFYWCGPPTCMDRAGAGSATSAIVR